ncbi:MAG: hypothetical protein K6B41_03630 [Butyrivibrio sp.]|nr:hypothetical protein [Butyrivibrio sp.]
MLYCPKCKIMIRGHKECCPLCQGALTDSFSEEIKNNFLESGIDPEDTDSAFPVLPKKKVSSLSVLKMSTFIFTVFEIIFIAVNLYTGNSIPWIGIAIVGTFVAWIDVLVTLYFHNNILKVVTVEVMFAIVVTLVIDYRFGFYGWSLMWTIPIMLLMLALFTYLCSRITRLRLEQYIMYIVVDALVSMLQIIGIVKEYNHFAIPALVSIIAYLIMIAAAIIFRFRDLKSATQRIFNV